MSDKTSLFTFSNYQDFKENFEENERIYNNSKTDTTYLDVLFEIYKSMYNFDRINDELLKNDNIESIDENIMINMPLIKIKFAHSNHKNNYEQYDSILSLNGFLYEIFRQYYSSFKKKGNTCFKEYLLNNDINLTFKTNDNYIYQLFFDIKNTTVKYSTLHDCINHKRYNNFHKNIIGIFSLKEYKKRIIDCYLIYNDLFNKINDDVNSSFTIHKIRLDTLKNLGVFYELDMIRIDRQYQKEMLKNIFGISPDLSKKYINAPLKNPNKLFDFDLGKVRFDRFNGLFSTRNKFLLRYLLLQKCGIEKSELMRSIQKNEMRYAVLASLIGCSPETIRKLEKTSYDKKCFDSIVNKIENASFEEVKILQRDIL